MHGNSTGLGAGVIGGSRDGALKVDGPVAGVTPGSSPRSTR
jgi:hypothetical protein